MKKIIIIITLLIVGFLVVKLDFSKNKETPQKVIKEETNYEDNIIDSNNDLFKDYYKKAKTKVKSMSLDEKISQLLLVRYPDENQLEIMKKYNFGGYLFFAKDFKDKTKEEVVEMISTLQSNSKIPLITAVDEEGGIVVRVSSNPNLRSERFSSPQVLYKSGGLDLIKADTLEKCSLLSSLGINVNLAPVVDVSMNPDDYIYNRTLGEDYEVTASFANTVITTSKDCGVSFTLKHFPGYGSNLDTHDDTSVDSRSIEEIKSKDLLPFKSGIDSGAEAILISHNVVENIDKENPASLSKSVHELLINDLDFGGVIITDDLDMGAIASIEDSTVKAVLANNHVIITTDYLKSINEIKKAINDKVISEKLIDRLVTRVIEWKYYKKILV